MEIAEAVGYLSALAHPSRLEVFRLLVRSGGGVCPGDIADQLDLPKTTLSFHLKELHQAQLIEQKRDGRSIIYRVRAEGMRELLGFLTEDCCQGRPELCIPTSEECCTSINTQE